MPFIHTQSGDTPLHLAVSYGHFETVKAINSPEAKPVRNSVSIRPDLHNAVKNLCTLHLSVVLFEFLPCYRKIHVLMLTHQAHVFT